MSPRFPQPAWVAFSSHDYQDDDLRRRWDDPELHREGDQPVVYAGAGSHSGAFIPGDTRLRPSPGGSPPGRSRRFRSRAESEDRHPDQPGRGTPRSPRDARRSDPARAAASAHQETPPTVGRDAGATHAVPEVMSRDQHPAAAGLPDRHPYRLPSRLDRRDHSPGNRVHRGRGHCSPATSLAPSQRAAARRIDRADRRVPDSPPMALAHRDLGARRSRRRGASGRQPPRSTPSLSCYLRSTRWRSRR